MGQGAGKKINPPKLRWIRACMQGTLVVDWLEDKQDGGFIFFRDPYAQHILIFMSYRLITTT